MHSHQCLALLVLGLTLVAILPPIAAPAYMIATAVAPFLWRNGSEATRLPVVNGGEALPGG